MESLYSPPRLDLGTPDGHNTPPMHAGHRQASWPNGTPHLRASDLVSRPHPASAGSTGLCGRGFEHHVLRRPLAAPPLSSATLLCVPPYHRLCLNSSTSSLIRTNSVLSSLIERKFM